MKRVPFLVCFWLALNLGAEGLAGQVPREVVQRFAQALASQSGGSMAGLMDRGGVRLRLGGSSFQDVGPRRATAALDRRFGASEGVEVRVESVSVVDGIPPKAFAELRWSGNEATTGEFLSLTLFVGLSLGSGIWYIDEIRTLEPS